MSEQNISATLRKLMFNKNMKVIDLARAAKIPQPTLQRIVSGGCTRPHMSSLMPLADFFSITIDQLLGHEPIAWLDNVHQHLENMGIRQVPMLDWHAAANSSTILAEKQAKPPNILTESQLSSDAFALTVKDSSMEPLFPVGTNIIFDPHKPIRDRHYVLIALAHYHEAVFRQLILDADNYFIKSLNPDLNHFRMQALNKDDRILGVLVEAKHCYA